MTSSNPNRLRLVTPEQEAAAKAIVSKLLTGEDTGAPADLDIDLASSRTQSRIRAVKIPSSGVELDALAAEPLTAGPHPLVVLPAGLDELGWKMYGGAIVRLLLRGYAVVAYTERGLPGSEGELTVAGPEDIADASAVIDWALANMKADYDAVGMMGLSYGSGISLLTANTDYRVKAVVALSAWADLAEALYDNDTPHALAAEKLAEVSEQPSKELLAVLEDFRAGDMDAVYRYGRPRSPAHNQDGLTSRSVPLFLSTYWHETIFPQNQLVRFATNYEGPVRLDVAVGDHGAVEIPGVLFGLPTRTTEGAYKWLDRFLRGMSNGIDTDGKLHLETMHSFAMSANANLIEWGSVAHNFKLHPPAAGSTDGLIMDGGTPDGFEATFTIGTEQVYAAEALVVDGIQERLRKPRSQQLSAVDRKHAAVWSTPPWPDAIRVSGIPVISMSASTTADSVTVVAYLFDRDSSTDTMLLITHAAVTLTPYQRKDQIVLWLQATDYEVAQGHNLTLIIDAQDRLYTFPGKPVSPGTVTLSARTTPITLAIPFG
ncbi:CocE/NonD family hydrolase [Nocardia sp. NPDC004750]